MLNPGTRLASLLVATLVVGSATEGARAGTLVLDIGPNAAPANLTDADWTQGTELIVSAALQVDGLGYLDLEGDGLAVSHEVAVWTAAGALVIPSLVITPTSSTMASANGTAQWFVEAIVPTVLDPGVYRIGGTFRTSNDASAGNEPLNFLGTTRGLFDLGGGIEVPGYVRSDLGIAPLTFPNVKFGGARTTVTLTATLVPEPGLSALLALALGAIACLGRRRPTPRTSTI